jgi:hypothetical protein
MTEHSVTTMRAGKTAMRPEEPFTPKRPPRPTRDLDQAKRDLADLGVCVLAGALTPDALSRVRTQLYAAAEEDLRLDRPSGGKGADYDPANQRVWGLLNRGQAFIDLVEHPASVEILTEVLGPDFLLSSISANITGPGHGGMVMHCDQLFVPQPWPEKAQGVNVFWMIDDFTEANGGTLMAPGSHRQMRAPVAGQDETALVPLEGPAGAMCVMDGRVWHKTGRNRTTDQRRAGIFGWYVAPIYRTQENWFLSLNPLVLQSRPSERLLRMLGYRVEGMFFGHVNGYEPLPKDLDYRA